MCAGLVVGGVEGVGGWYGISMNTDTHHHQCQQPANAPLADGDAVGEQPDGQLEGLRERDHLLRDVGGGRVELQLLDHVERDGHREERRGGSHGEGGEEQAGVLPRPRRRQPRGVDVPGGVWWCFWVVGGGCGAGRDARGGSDPAAAYNARRRVGTGHAPALLLGPAVVARVLRDELRLLFD